MQKIENKIAWVTGAGTGIGRAGALALAEAGVKGMLAAIDLSCPQPIEYFFHHNINLISRASSIVLAPALTYSPKDLEKSLMKLKQSLMEIK